MDRKKAEEARKQAKEDSKKVDERWKEVTTKLDGITAQVDATYEIAVREKLRDRVRMRVRNWTISEFRYQTFDKMNSNEEDFKKLKATLKNSGYLNLLRLLPSDAAAKLSIDAPRLELHLYALTPSTRVKTEPFQDNLDAVIAGDNQWIDLRPRSLEAAAAKR